MMRKDSYLERNANERIKDPGGSILKQKIDHGLRNRQAIIKNLERQSEYLEKIQPSKSLPHTINTKPIHEFVYKPPSIRNENDKGDVLFIKEDETQPIPTMPNPTLLILTLQPNGVLTKKEIKKDEMGMPKEHNQEWKLNEKVVPHNEE
ncbi:hypothetical protein Tco_1375303, partial [Tanacetum coccineum]